MYYSEHASNIATGVYYDVRRPIMTSAGLVFLAGVLLFYSSLKLSSEIYIHVWEAIIKKVAMR